MNIFNNKYFSIITVILLIVIPLAVFSFYNEGVFDSSMNNETQSSSQFISANYSASPLSTNQETQIDVEIDEADKLNHANEISIDTSVVLNEEEVEDLLFIREEEKLARDVYQFLYSKWDQKIFSNIAKSEQTHTDSIKTLIDSYNLEDPFLSEEGKFSSQELQELYNDLTTQGSQSLVEALNVGALIEDLDIKDLEDAKSRTDNIDITSVYNNLQKGSRNHLRAFTSNLKKKGVDYEPSYISKEQFDGIINSPQEKGRV